MFLVRYRGFYIVVSVLGLSVVGRVFGSAVLCEG